MSVGFFSFLFVCCRTRIYMREPSSDHDFFSEDLCGDNRFRIYEFDRTEIVVRVEQYHKDIPFDGAYAIVNGNMESGTFYLICVCKYKLVLV